VRIAYGDGALILEVDDDGITRQASRPAGRPDSRAGGPGNGIAGMTERAKALGGTLQAGLRPDGGFGVRASLPVQGGAS
jgi:signal transduction histidine kinase